MTEADRLPPTRVSDWPVLPFFSTIHGPVTKAATAKADPKKKKPGRTVSIERPKPRRFSTRQSGAGPKGKT